MFAESAGQEIQKEQAYGNDSVYLKYSKFRSYVELMMQRHANRYAFYGNNAQSAR